VASRKVLREFVLSFVTAYLDGNPTQASGMAFNAALKLLILIVQANTNSEFTE
jgi:hypothetical protein